MSDILVLYFEAFKYAVDSGRDVVLENGKFEYTSKTLGSLCDNVSNEDKLVLRAYLNKEEDCDKEEDCEDDCDD